MPNDTNLTDRLLVDETAVLSSLDFGPLVRQGKGCGPSLPIGDALQIRLKQSTRMSCLEPATAHLAKSGGIVVPLSPPNGAVASTANLLIFARPRTDAVQLGKTTAHLSDTFD